MFVNIRKAFSYFKSNFPIKKTSKNWYKFDCPFCLDIMGSRKMAVQFNWERCKCWKCGYNENIIQFVMDYEDVRYKRAQEIINSSEESDINLEVIEEIVIEKSLSAIELPLGYTPLMDGEGILGKRAREYMSNRGFDIEKLDMRGFGYCREHDEDFYKDFFGRIIIPFKADGKLVYYIGRTFLEDDLRVKNPPADLFGVGKADLIFNEDALNLYDEVFLLEGWADALTIGDNAISTQGWSVSAIQKSKILKSSCKTLTIIPDKGFYNEAVKTALNFIEEKRIRIVNMDNVMAEDSSKKDVNEIGLELVRNEINKTEAMTLSRAMDILI